MLQRVVPFVKFVLLGFTARIRGMYKVTWLNSYTFHFSNRFICLSRASFLLLFSSQAVEIPCASGSYSTGEAASCTPCPAGKMCPVKTNAGKISGYTSII